MKRFALLLLLCVFTFPNISAQETNNQDELKGQEAVEYWHNRYIKKRGTARGFLYTGLGLITIGTVLALNADDWGELGGGAGMFALGTVSSLASIPFYIRANSFNKKAFKAREPMKVSFGTIRSPQRTDLGIGLTYTF